MNEILLKLNTNSVGHIGLTLLVGGIGSLCNPVALNAALSHIGVQLSEPALGAVISLLGGSLAYLGKPLTVKNDTDGNPKPQV